MVYFASSAVLFIVLMVSAVLFMASRYRRCPSDKILVIYGKVGEGQSARCIHGGGSLVWPLIQDYAYLNLTPMTINIPLQKALSMQNIRINVPSTFTVGISTDENIMNNAAERLLHLDSNQIEDMAKEIIFGQLRLTVASLTIEQINQDRESFLDSIRKNVAPELNKIGLYLINVNITDLTDESDYIGSIGKKAAAEAINQALIDVSIQQKKGAIGEAEALKEREIKVAENMAEADKGKKAAEIDRRIFVQTREAEAVTGENKARATIAETNAQLAVKQAEAMRIGEVAVREAAIEIQKAQARAETERLNAEEVVQKEIEKRKIEIEAEAEAEKTRRLAKGEADGILLKYEAEAKGIQQVLTAKVEAVKNLVLSCGGDPAAAATILMTQKLDELVPLQIEAIRNLKIDQVVVWDSGAGDGNSSTANFASSLIKAIPPLAEVARMTGINLPAYMGDMTKKIDKGETNNE